MNIHLIQTISQLNPSFHDPFHAALGSRNFPILDVLISYSPPNVINEAKADPNETNARHQQPAILTALAGKNFVTARFLLKKGNVAERFIPDVLTSIFNIHDPEQQLLSTFVSNNPQAKWVHVLFEKGDGWTNLFFKYYALLPQKPEINDGLDEFLEIILQASNSRLDTIPLISKLIDETNHIAQVLKIQKKLNGIKPKHSMDLQKNLMPSRNLYSWNNHDSSKTFAALIKKAKNRTLRLLIESQKKYSRAPIEEWKISDFLSEKRKAFPCWTTKSMSIFNLIRRNHTEAEALLKKEEDCMKLFFDSK